MQVQQSYWTAGDGWCSLPETSSVDNPQLVLYFAAPGALNDRRCYADLRARFPDAHLLGCTTGGEILDDEVMDDGAVATAIELQKTTARYSSARVENGEDSHAAGAKIGEELAASDLRCIFVLSDGVRVNGSNLVRGIIENVGPDIPVMGGLAGDGARFEVTLVGVNSEPEEGMIGGVGLYGSSLRIGHGSVGGWDVFGPERKITRAKNNILYELDGKPALDLYKIYLGDEAKNLPGSGLLFPLKVRPAENSGSDVVRTIVGIDESEQSMIFAGDVPEGHVAQLMRGNFDNLIAGAGEAARVAMEGHSGSAQLAVLVSCIGRKLLLGQRIGEEVEAVRESLGAGVPQVGFYSYGEISPHASSNKCELHNQTMTITVFSET